MKIIYVANARIPTQRAHGKQIMKTCEALADSGIDLELWLPNRLQTKASHRLDPFAFYHCRRLFKIRKFPTFDLLTNSPKLPQSLLLVIYYLQEWSFAFSLLTAKIDGVVYGRCFSACLLLKLFKRVPVYYEAHDVSTNLFLRWVKHRLIKFFSGFVAVSPGIKSAYEEVGQIKTAVITNGVDLEEFPCLKKNRSWKEKVAVYAGTISQDKGAFDLVLASQILKKSGVGIVLLGSATGEDNSRLKEILSSGKFTNLTIAGFIPPWKVGRFLSSADVLVAPNRADSFFSREITCPMKIFEYLASSVPIVATNTPAHRAILKDKVTALLVPPNNPIKLAAGIAEVVNNQPLAAKLAVNARLKARAFSWSKRAKKIINIIA